MIELNGVMWCTLHSGVISESEETCDMYGFLETEDEECVLVPMFIRDDECGR